MGKLRKAGTINRRVNIEVYFDVVRDQRHAWMIEYEEKGKLYFLAYGGRTREEARNEKKRLQRLYRDLNLNLYVKRYVPLEPFDEQE